MSPHEQYPELVAAWQRGPLPLDAANDTPALRAFIVQIKRGRAIRLTFEAMGTSSFAVREQHEGLLQEGEYIVVRPREVHAWSAI